MNQSTRTKSTAHLSLTNATRALITMTLARKGPLKIVDLQKAVKLRRSAFLKGLKYLVEIGAVCVVGRGIKGNPLVYSLTAEMKDDSKPTGAEKRRRLMIV